MKIPLTVYKASAGSGKTFRLAVDYIKLLVEDPTAYRRILAVTFTNKATEEMKMRILTQLYGISHHCNDGETQDYIDIITHETGHNAQFVRQRAAIALDNLLHNYSYFRVETIDSFFQSVLRNLARELDLTANLRIELNDTQIEQQAVGNLIESLDTNSQELTWILDYINENIEEDKSWNIIWKIEKFGENIFKDIYKQNSQEINEKLHEKDFFKSYTKRLRSIRQEAEADMQQFATDFYEKLQQQGIDVSDFSNGERGVAGYFKKLANRKYNDKDLVNATVVKALEDPMAWLKKADQTPETPLYSAVINVFHPLLLESEKKRPQNLRLYKSADLTLRHLSQLRLLNSIDKHVRELNKQSNRFLLS
ncbi:MAG: UvrD-helicase domain-containing protein, partial [Prevotella sp.]|nr:UvrD-helicase domain-containing protein [Prevotella sp.]